MYGRKLEKQVGAQREEPCRNPNGTSNKYTPCYRGINRSVPHTDTLLVEEPVAVLKANRVWGALRGEFCAVSLLVSSKIIYPVMLCEIKHSETAPWTCYRMLY